MVQFKSKSSNEKVPHYLIIKMLASYLKLGIFPNIHPKVGINAK